MGRCIRRWPTRSQPAPSRFAGNTIVRVGSNQDVEPLRARTTQVVDAGAARCCPASTTRMCIFWAADSASSRSDLAGLLTLPEIQAKIRAFADAHPDDAWFARPRLAGYTPFPGGLPIREQLDAVVSDRPAIMSCYDGHSVWVNSKALALAGITRTTPNPANGVIVKDARTGEPTGVLKESASRLMSKVTPKPTRDAQVRAIRAASDYAHRLGVTSVQERRRLARGAPAVRRGAKERHDLTVRTTTTR